MPTDEPTLSDEYATQRVEETQIWNHPQFFVADVCKVTGTTPKALEHFVNPKRELVRLVGAHANPGTGKRRIFTGGQVLMIAAAYAMTRIGFPQRWVRTLADTVERRAILTSATSVTFDPNMVIMTYPMKTGADWAFKTIYDGKQEKPELPPAYHCLHVDRLIDQVRAQLQALIDETEVPTFDIPDPEPEPNPYSPASNFFRMWEKSSKGGWKYVGLSDDESEELLRLQGFEIVDDEIVYGEPVRGSLGRSVELQRKHEEARMRIIDEERER